MSNTGVRPDTHKKVRSHRKDKEREIDETSHKGYSDNDGDDGVQHDSSADGIKEPELIVIIAGLYISTTVSGSAFCFKKGGQWSRILMNKNWANDHGITTSTIPTIIAQDVKKNCFHIGHDAITKYTKAGNATDFILWQTNDLQFKKNVEEKSDQSTLIFLKTIIQELKKCVEVQLTSNRLWPIKGNVNIKWVVTCADVMKHDLSMEFLRQVIQVQDIDIVSEDKAAAVWCSAMPIYELTDKPDPSLNDGTFYSVIDVESGYISVFKKKTTMEVEQLATQFFILDLPEMYEKLLCEVFEPQGNSTIADYKDRNKRDWFVMLKDMQTQINGIGDNEEMQINLSLPNTFIEYFNYVKPSKSNSFQVTDDMKLVIKQTYFHNEFNSCASRILYYLSGLNDSCSYPITFLFLIGKATLLDKPISKYTIEKSLSEPLYPKVNFQEIKEPEDSGACALKGAVLVGRDNAFETVRI